MNDFLERFKSLETPLQKEKFLMEINAHIDARAATTDDLKKLHYIRNKETNDLCILRDLLIQKLKEEK